MQSVGTKELILKQETLVLSLTHMHLPVNSSLTSNSCLRLCQPPPDSAKLNQMGSVLPPDLILV